MKRIKDWIIEKQASHFIGRTKELQLMKDQLLHNNIEWHLLYFYGASGSGKTALLQRFEQIIIEVPVIYISEQNQRRFNQTLFLQHIADSLLAKALIPTSILEIEVTSILNELAENNGKFILLFDDMDQWIAIDHWLQSEWIPLLSTNVRICSTGRAPLVNIYPPLMKEFIISEALSPVINNWFEQESIEVTELLEAAVILKYFDLKLLEKILNKSIATEQFIELCNRTYVQKAGLFGWSVMDEVRNKIRKKTKTNHSLKYVIFKQRAELALNERLQQLGIDEHEWHKHEIVWRKFSLLENDFLQGILFCGSDDGYVARPATETELPILEMILSNNVDTLLPYKIDELEMHSYITKLWMVDPNTVQSVYRYNKLVGLYFLVPINKQTSDVLAHNPITKSFIELGTFDEHDYFVYTVASLPAFDFEIFGHILRQLLYNEVASRRLTFLLPMKDQVQAFELLGFQHLEWARFQASGGLMMYFVQLDSVMSNQLPALYTDSFIQLDHLTDSSAKIVKEIVQTSNMDHSLKTWETLVKHLLEKFSDIQSPHIKDSILHTFRCLKKGNAGEQIQAQILQHRYLQRKGTHDNIAAMLYLPIATYYRHLRRLNVTLAKSLHAEFYPELEEK